MEKKTYQAQGECYNCGYENYPQWGTYQFGKLIEEYPCPNCECQTWHPRGKRMECSTPPEHYEENPPR